MLLTSIGKRIEKAKPGGRLAWQFLFLSGGGSQKEETSAIKGYLS